MCEDLNHPSALNNNGICKCNRYNSNNPIHNNNPCSNNSNIGPLCHHLRNKCSMSGQQGRQGGMGTGTRGAMFRLPSSPRNSSRHSSSMYRMVLRTGDTGPPSLSLGATGLPLWVFPSSSNNPNQAYRGKLLATSRHRGIGQMNDLSNVFDQRFPLAIREGGEGAPPPLVVPVF